MKKVILISGGGSMVGKHLEHTLASSFEIRFLSRNPKKSNQYLWDIDKNFIDSKALLGVTHVIHLAGNSIIDKRWTKCQKEEIIKSRVGSAHLILSHLKKNNITLESFITASAVGYYGFPKHNNLLCETDEPGDGFLSEVCIKWENAALEFKKQEIARMVKIVRIGVVLSDESPALKKIIKPIKLGVSILPASGKPFFPWIHIEDLSNVFAFLLGRVELEGAFNAVAPEQLRFVEFAKSIVKRMKKRVIEIRLPKKLFQFLLGERAVLLVEGNKISSKKIEELGFSFRYKNIESASKNLLK